MNRYINKSTLFYAAIIPTVFGIVGFIMVSNGGFCEGNGICLEKLQNEGPLVVIGIVLFLYMCGIFIEGKFGYEETEQTLNDRRTD